ncbi:MAG: hypothetical protein VW297_14490, partial [Paracoccaceae bacterium]
MNPALSVVAQASTEKEDFDLSSFQTTAATGENIRKPQKAKNPRISVFGQIPEIHVPLQRKVRSGLQC